MDPVSSSSTVLAMSTVQAVGAVIARVAGSAFAAPTTNGQAPVPAESQPLAQPAGQPSAQPDG